MGLRFCGFFALVLTLGGAAAIAGPGFRCSLKPISGTEWIPSRFSLKFADDFSGAVITDMVFGVTVNARVMQHSETSYMLNWALPKLAVGGDAGRPKPRFRAILNTANHKMSIKAERSGQDGVLPRGQGQCEMVRSLSLLAQNEG
ncbi:hypothetical protein [Leisingera sp. ANG-M6]|uniref:hypothetical protein n=1 Tax=Leisingera sp. ANG-M6 TaxID=1577900 RepID=UPI00057F3EAF|nr:hypothetical protein [Leisingera sp. ANG-M6]KIC30124.1 hypothetical protein RA24_04070 [Leisingera sp. ANG-M6]